MKYAPRMKYWLRQYGGVASATFQKHVAPPVVPNSQSCQCGSKGAERLGRFKWGPGQYNCQQCGLRGALQLLCSSTAEEIEILPGRFFARFLRIKKAHSPTTVLSVVSLQATLHSEVIETPTSETKHHLQKEDRAAVLASGTA